MSYFSDLASAKDEVVRVLSEKGIDERYLHFGGEGPVSQKKPRVPNDAGSEFLGNRAMGDWAEDVLAHAIRRSFPEWKVSHYGSRESTAAGDKGFREFYLASLEDVRKYGKRPDLLLFESDCEVPEDISMKSHEACEQFLTDMIAAIEVRSSKVEALTYMKTREKELQAGKKPERLTPSFTVKVEDLKIVHRWMELYQIPQSYCQVFFDRIYCINFLEVFRLIGKGENIKIETPAKSQQKATIMIPITQGVCVGEFTELPAFGVAERVTKLGRHDAYVVPIGGEVSLDARALRSVVIP